MYHHHSFNLKIEAEEQPEFSLCHDFVCFLEGVATQVLTGLKEQGRFQQVQIMHSEMSIRELDCLSANEDLCAVVKM
ncbi:hypothetical protein L6452_14045 [Arctium lappa]|uniref:Uncharacterized protein n=1 Tax=Arctium lappa TaxID=4217 RepID=A0ACB9CJW6_ARCLA|nr:hypothetical protein L6452_14045 [Arctium lappa]